jgi:nucleoside-diphosphate-sugar epimerase
MAEEGEVHTVFGAGQVGRKLADELLGRGKQVRIVRRSAAGDGQPGLTWMSGNLLETSFADEACQGAAVVYHCVSPPRYDRWATDLPPLFEAITGATQRAGAKLVLLDNVYMYGHAGGKPYTEDTPMRPCSEKGKLRAELAQGLLDRQAAGELELAIGRAADFFGPGSVTTAIFHQRFFDQLAAGKKVDILGNPDAKHSYSYTPDVARGLAILGTSEEAWGKVWHLPVAFQGTTRELAQRFADALGQSLEIRPVPRWMLRLLGIFSPLIRATIEMNYQFEEDYVVDDARFRETFGTGPDLGPTDLDEAVRATLKAQCPGLLGKS